MKKISEKHLYSSEDKLQHWGYGEWVEEPDEIYFDHKGIQCHIKRVKSPEGHNLEHWFGGHLCGYILVPENHPWKGICYASIDCEVHGGLTYSDWGIPSENSLEVEQYWIGFDCAHSNDICPSMERFLQARPEDPILETYKERFPYIFQKTYRNIAYVKQECRNLVEQMLNVENPVV